MKRNKGSAFRILPGALTVLAALALLLQTGCVLRANTGEDTGFPVYRLSDGGGKGGQNSALAPEYVTAREGETAIDALRRALNAEPEGDGLSRAFPQGAELLSCRVEHGTAICEVGAEYARLTGIRRSLADCALVSTLYGLDEVLRVDILRQGETLSEGLRQEDTLLADALYGGCPRIIKLFVPDDGTLAPRSVLITLDGEKQAEELAVQELLAALDSLPEGTRLLSTAVQDGLCVVNLSEELFTTEPESAAAARLLLSSFVETLTFLDGVDRVRIDVNGFPMSSYGSYTPVWPAVHDPAYEP